MTSTTTKAEAVHPEAGSTSYLFDDWFDPIEASLRDRVRGFIETMLETELDAVLSRPRYGGRCEANYSSASGVAGRRLASVTSVHVPIYGVTLALLMTVVALYMLVFLIYTSLDQMRSALIIAGLDRVPIKAARLCQPWKLDIQRKKAQLRRHRPSLRANAPELRPGPSPSEIR